MNMDDLGLEEGLLRALRERGSDALYPYLEKTVQHVNIKKESVSAQVRLASGREDLYMVPLLQWLLTEGAGGRALVVLATDQDVAAVRGRVSALAEAAGIPVHGIGHDSDGADGTAPLSMGAADVLASRYGDGTLELKTFGFVVVDGADRLAESPLSSHLRRIRAGLAPSRERRTIIFTDKLGVKEQTLALDLAEAPAELYLEEETEKVKHVPQATWYVAADAKMRLLLGVLASGGRSRAAVFCNLRESAEETARRLQANGKKVEFVLGNLPQQRKDAILAQVRAGELDAVVLTDEGSRGVALGSFSLVVNYDMPLEGEPYLDRVRLLDAGAPGARVVNFACDRYVYGIPAVEQFMGMSLGAVQAEDSLFAPEDRSAGMSFGRPGRPGERGGSRGDRDFRRPRGDDRGFDRDNRGRPRDGDPRNQASIRAGIAELTGVNLGGSGARGRTPENQPPRAGGEPERGASGGRRKKKNKRPGATGTSGRSFGQPARSSFADPYSMPMEERMRLYREKYGKRLTEEKPPKPAGKRKGRRRKGGSPGNPSLPEPPASPGTP